MFYIVVSFTFSVNWLQQLIRQYKRHFFLLNVYSLLFYCKDVLRSLPRSSINSEPLQSESS